jgi:hypothetical protein
MVNSLGDTLGDTKTRIESNETQLGNIDNPTYFEFYGNAVYPRLTNLFVSGRSYVGSTLIWGNSGQGIWNSYKWGSEAYTMFVLGNPSAGVLGINQLGSNDSPLVRMLEKYVWLNYEDSFTTTGSKDTGNTSASWTGTGSVVFTKPTGSVMQTINLTNKLQRSDTYLTNFNVDVSGSYFWTVEGSVSTDGARTWTPVSNFGNTQSVTSTAGSEPIIRLIDRTGSVVLTDITAFFTTDDIS